MRLIVVFFFLLYFGNIKLKLIKKQFKEFSRNSKIIVIDELAVLKMSLWRFTLRNDGDESDKYVFGQKWTKAAPKLMTFSYVSIARMPVDSL